MSTAGVTAAPDPNTNRNNNNGATGGSLMESTDSFLPSTVTDGDNHRQQRARLRQHLPPQHKEFLDPFVHQVSGRAHMLTFDSTTICKSLSTREWRFYTHLPRSLRAFTPELKGVLFVQLQRDNGIPHHRFKSSGIFLRRRASSTPAHDGCDVTSLDGERTQAMGEDRVQTYDQILFKGLERLHYATDHEFTSHPWTVDKDQEAVTEAVGRNPWSLRQHRREIHRTLDPHQHLRAQVDLSALWRELQLESSHVIVDHRRVVSEQLESRIANADQLLMKAYLLLEDVTSQYRFPSILDLKVGTQLDRSDCSQTKKDKHFNLVQRSSTGSLGLRLAGMQVYQATTGQYLCRDKYYGRGLSTKGFIVMLERFLHDGRRHADDVVPHVIARLLELRREVERHDTFRFHASSVLITYEGGDRTRDPPLVRVHMIDFAHSTFRGFLDDATVYAGPDRDCLHALDNLVSILRDIQLRATSDVTNS